MPACCRTPGSHTTKQAAQTIHLTGGARWSQVPQAVNAGDSKNAVFLLAYGYVAKDK
jgi:hypothetical protein